MSCFQKNWVKAFADKTEKVRWYDPRDGTFAGTYVARLLAGHPIQASLHSKNIADASSPSDV